MKRRGRGQALVIGAALIAASMVITGCETGGSKESKAVISQESDVVSALASTQESSLSDGSKETEASSAAETTGETAVTEKASNADQNSASAKAKTGTHGAKAGTAGTSGKTETPSETVPSKTTPAEPVKPQVAGEIRSVESGNTAQSGTGSGSTAEKTPDQEDPAVPSREEPAPENPSDQDAYHLVWEDDFNGGSLNTKDWNYEYHEPGWVNNELQEYVDSSDNVFVKDGILYLKAVKKTDAQGNITYTSGRINTQNKHDFKYGKFEVRAKVPSGKGFLPAFWMMPTQEELYGQWPKCGEIDIMEVLGDQTDKAYGTLHFGEPHTQKQGSFQLPQGEDYASQYHTFTCDWEPDQITFYVDGKEYYSTGNWFTKKTGFDEVTYPAPFDQPFYMILNLAVGGNWPGNPGAADTFGENAQYCIDYVKVYQKDSYNENVTKPADDVTLRDADATGNYCRNGSFTEQESLTDDAAWKFLLAGEGEAEAQIKDQAIHITTKNAANLDYSVQLVQADQPMEKGYTYRLSFDAWADADRTMITDISAPDNGYIRYLSDTKVNMTTEKKSYSYDFDMTQASDPNGRIEFNLGNQSSTAAVHITNVRLVKVKQAEITEQKGVLPDGNYVYNGGFDQGSDRLKYWEIQNSCDGAKVSVSNQNNQRELTATVPATVTDPTQVTLSQKEIALSGGKKYVLSFDASAETEGSTPQIKVILDGESYSFPLTSTTKGYSQEFTTKADTDGAELKILLGNAGTTHLDNVRIQQSGLVINGDFSNGMSGYDFFTDSSVSGSVSGSVVKEGNDNVFTAGIQNTGDAEWKIQLKQNGIKLESGKCYRMSFDACATKDRWILYALQKDGSKDNDWTPYSGSNYIQLTNDWQNYIHTFKMDWNTDPETILSISMGAVKGAESIGTHNVSIRNIEVEEIPESELQNETAENLTVSLASANIQQALSDVTGNDPQ